MPEIEPVSVKDKALEEMPGDVGGLTPG